MLAVGVTVRVRDPFNEQFPGEYLIEGQSETGAWRITGGVDFDPEYLEVV